jgi:hypothetical protein
LDLFLSSIIPASTINLISNSFYFFVFLLLFYLLPVLLYFSGLFSFDFSFLGSSTRHHLSFIRLHLTLCLFNRFLTHVSSIKDEPKIEINIC